MSINCLVFTTRRADLTLEQFKDYYETKHAPFVDELFSDCTPEEYVRFYIDRSEKDNAAWFTGSPGDFDYDCCTRLTWKSQEFWDAAQQKLGNAEVQKALAEDEANFLDRSKTKLVLVGEGFGRGA